MLLFNIWVQESIYVHDITNANSSIVYPYFFLSAWSAYYWLWYMTSSSLIICLWMDTWPASIIWLFFFKDFYLFIWQTEITSRQRGRQRERGREAGSPLSREPNLGLNPKTLGSRPEPKAEALTQWATQAPPWIENLNKPKTSMESW